jgi:hypothetical protein
MHALGGVLDKTLDPGRFAVDLQRQAARWVRAGGPRPILLEVANERLTFIGG